MKDPKTVSIWRNNPHVDSGYVVIIDGKIVAWCEWYEKQGRWNITEPFHVRGANGKEYTPTVGYDA